MKTNKKLLGISVFFLTAFLLWTVAVCCVDVQEIGPNGTAVGFAGINQYIHELTGVHNDLYTITDWLSLVPLGVAVAFGILGLAQWIRRKNILKVDRSILVLGGFYFAVAALYAIFEILVVNYRPVLIGGVLEPSYPSSTTMLVGCIMPTALMQIKVRIDNEKLKKWIACLGWIFTAFMVITRLISGVHWCTDIIGGMLLSAGLVMMYSALVGVD